MSASKFIYVTYIRTTQEKLWDALLKPEFSKQYWFGCHQECTWEQGAEWKLMFPDGTLGDQGKVLEIDKPRRLVLEWRNQFRPELHAEGASRCTMELETVDAAVKLTVTHEIDAPESKFIEAVSGGWPKILSSLKSLLETGKPLDEIDSIARADRKYPKKT